MQFYYITTLLRLKRIENNSVFRFGLFNLTFSSKKGYVFYEIKLNIEFKFLVEGRPKWLHTFILMLFKQAMRI